jgi:protein-S-isoprenylcysteine O-methyltransferase Ste14
MDDLNKKAFGGFLRLLISLAVLLFLPAWTFDYWQAWIFLAVFSGSVLMITLYLIKQDPRLLKRRINAGPSAEKERSQKVIQTLALIAFIVVFVFFSSGSSFRMVQGAALYRRGRRSSCRAWAADHISRV